ncbi:MAG: NTP transferase domain-containing protein [Candidatus Thorarchaeota archaeon]
MSNENKKHYSGIILAGGQSSRFQINTEPWLDKALYVFDNQSLLERTIFKLDLICSQIIIVVNNSDRKNKYSAIIKNLPEQIRSKIIVIIDDSTILCSGPTLGLISGVKVAKRNQIIVTPVDMPFLDHTIYSSLLSNLDSSSLIIPYWELSGKIEPLVMALNKEKVVKMFDILSYLRESRADDIHRAVTCSKFLLINNENTSLADTLLMSINERNADNFHLKQKENPSVSLFDVERSILFTVPYSELLLIKTMNFLKEKSFLELNNEIVTELGSLSDELIQAHYYFLSGIILNEFLDKFPMKGNLTASLNDVKKNLTKKCIESFLLEAQQWQQKNINFLEYHALQDAQNILKKQILPENQEIFSRIQQLKDKMNLKKKNHSHQSFDVDIIQKMPNFISKTKELINGSEKAFNEESPVYNTEFLWDHSLRVSKIAYFITQKEGVDPFVPTIGALLHDAGKFILGGYHLDNIPEENHSAAIGEKLLLDEGIEQTVIDEIKKAVTALYNDSFSCNSYCQIIQDADRLDKLGVFGIANFFSKATLRGTNLTSSVIRNLSRELTYAFASPQTMYTSTGKELATTRSEDTFSYFNKLLEEMKLYGIGNFLLKNFTYKNYENIWLVIPSSCAKCQGQFLIDFDVEKGLKCEKLTAYFKCNYCDEKFHISFCLPIVNERK